MQFQVVTYRLAFLCLVRLPSAVGVNLGLVLLPLPVASGCLHASIHKSGGIFLGAVDIRGVRQVSILGGHTQAASSIASSYVRS